MPFCDPTRIIIPEDRFRKADPESSEVVNLSKSIKEIGQLQPVLVTKEMELVDGLFRLTACEVLKRDVWYEDEVTGQLLLNSPLQRRTAELQANLNRKSFTPAEFSRATDEIDRLMRELHGNKVASPGFQEGWTQEDTAKKLGYKSHATVSNAILVARALETGEAPELEKAGTMSEAVKMVKDIVKMRAVKEAVRRQAAVSDTEVKDPIKFFGTKIILGDCLEKMKELPSGICNLFVTDPPFGVGLDKVLEKKNETAAKVKKVYDDVPDDILKLLKNVINEMARVGKPVCVVVMFCAIKHWHTLREWFIEAGFSTYERALLWIKASKDPFKIYAGRTMNPVITPASAYEAAVYAWRGPFELAQPGLSDVFHHAPLPSQKKIHSVQKPVSLLKEMISRFYRPEANPLLIDPFAGSASTLIAAQQLGFRQYFGYEISAEFRERAITNMVKAYLDDQKEPEIEFDIEELGL